MGLFVIKGGVILRKKWVIFLTVFILSLLVACSQQTIAEQIEEKLNLGNKYLSENNYEEAVLAFEEAIEIDPMTTEAYIGLSQAYVFLGKYEEAEAALLKGIEVVDDPNALRDHLASHYQEREQYKQAEEIYLVMLEDGEVKVKAIDGLIFIYEHTGERQKLLDLLETAYELTGNKKYREYIEDLLYINSGEKLEEFKEEKARFQTVMKDRYGNEYNVFLYSENENVSTIDLPSIFGSAGDTILKGDYRVVLQNKVTQEYYLQDIVLENKHINTNLTKPYVIENSPDLLVFKEVETSASRIDYVYALGDTGLERLYATSTAHTKLKQVDQNIIQALSYDRFDGIYTFRTLKLDVSSWDVEVVEEIVFDFEEGRTQHEQFSGSNDYIVTSEGPHQNTTVYIDVLLNEDDLLDENARYLLALIEHAENGSLGEGVVPLGTPAEELVNTLGEPLSIEGYQGSELYIYEDAIYSVPFEYHIENRETNVIFLNDNHFVPLTKAQVISALGEPDDAWDDFNVMMAHEVMYVVGDYRVIFSFKSNDGSERFFSITLT